MINITIKSLLSKAHDAKSLLSSVGSPHEEAELLIIPKPDHLKVVLTDGGVFMESLVPAAAVPSTPADKPTRVKLRQLLALKVHDAVAAIQFNGSDWAFTCGRAKGSFPATAGIPEYAEPEYGSQSQRIVLPAEHAWQWSTYCFPPEKNSALHTLVQFGESPSLSLFDLYRMALIPLQLSSSANNTGHQITNEFEEEIRFQPPVGLLKQFDRKEDVTIFLNREDEVSEWASVTLTTQFDRIIYPLFDVDAFPDIRDGFKEQKDRLVGKYRIQKEDLQRSLESCASVLTAVKTSDAQIEVALTPTKYTCTLKSGNSSMDCEGPVLEYMGADSCAFNVSIRQLIEFCALVRPDDFMLWVTPQAVVLESPYGSLVLPQAG